MVKVRYPSLYQVNTRVWLTELSQQLGRRATLDDIPDAELDQLQSMGFDWVWFLSVWQTGLGAQQVSRSNPDWQREFHETLPDLHQDDIGGSGFAITGYTVHTDLGGDAALARLRERLLTRGLKLMLDFVPNHMGLGHPWVEEHPEYFVAGSELDIAHMPKNYVRVKRGQGEVILAYGRDPYFAGWPDTLQLNYANPATQQAMTEILLKISKQCDGVRCDMAMLVLPNVFERTWQRSCPPFWPGAIQRVRDQVPDFCFMAEVYWDLEWTMQHQGFDYAYDKRLYDRLRDQNARSVREHMLAGLDYQDKLARFLENHDEPRAASTFSLPIHEAAAAITFLSPGLRFFHQGQFEGKKTRISPHLIRGPVESVDEVLKSFYESLLKVLKRDDVRQGKWQLLSALQTWDGDWTNGSFVLFAWEGSDQSRLVIAVNYSSHQSQCYVRLPWEDLGSSTWQFHDLLQEVTYDRAGDELRAKGLFLDVPAWKTHVFDVSRI